MDIVRSPCGSFDLHIESWRANTIASQPLQGRIGVALLHMLRSALLLVAVWLLAAAPAPAADLRVVAYVVGWETEGFSDAALSAQSRNAFADSVVALLREYSLDGVDIDWEYPGQSVAGIKSRPEDKQNFTALLQTLRARLGSRYLLTIASADREYFDFTEMDKLHVYLDYINVMTYDFFNALTPTTGHHAGLYASPHAAPTDRNADASIKQHLAAGIPPDKLVLGVAFYGRGFAG